MTALISCTEISRINGERTIQAYVVIDVSQGHRVCDAYATLVLFLEMDIRWLLVDANAEAFQFSLNNALVCEGLVHV